MHPAIIIGTVRSLIVDVAMGQIPRSTERISSFECFFLNFVLPFDGEIKLYISVKNRHFDAVAFVA